MTDKVYLGTFKKDAGTDFDGERCYLEKHKWDCGWYWGFGYLGNSRCHFHFDSLLKGETKTSSELFINPQYTDKQWWVIRDLFVQAYALKKSAEVYQYGGHQSSLEGITDILRNAEKAKLLNEDLEKVLNVLWKYLIDNQKTLS